MDGQIKQGSESFAQKNTSLGVKLLRNNLWMKFFDGNKIGWANVTNERNITNKKFFYCN